MPGEWVLLCYRIPREPSTPRIAVWRRLRALGVAQVGDGVAALPMDSRSREQLEWVAEQVEQAGGSSLLWTAVPASAEQERVLAEQMRNARSAEYEAVCDAAEAAGRGDGDGPGDAGAVLRRLRADLRRIERRDWFPPPQRAAARIAVRILAQHVAAAEPVRGHR